MRFKIGFSGLDWVPNYEKTRWFLVLRLKRPASDALNKLLHVSNKIVEEYGQPPLYANARTGENGTKSTRSIQNFKVRNFKTKGHQQKQGFDDMVNSSAAFHISIAWTLSPPDQELIEATERLTTNELMRVKQIEIKTEEIKAKIGNVVTNIPLPAGVTEGKNLFGI